MSFGAWLELLTSGLITGGIYALVALGLNLQYGLMRILNIAHGEFLMLGAYLTWMAHTGLGLSPLLMVPVSFVLLMALGLGVHWLCFRRLAATSPNLDIFEARGLMVAFGLMFLVQNFASLVWGGDLRGYDYLTTPVAVGNAQFAANYAHVPALPVIDLLADPFFLFGMFNGYQREVQELALQGQREGAWVPLAAAEFFPGPAHEHALWAQASRRVGELLTPRAIVRERARFLERIRLRHNALHPERRVERVRVGFLTWPKSRAGRDALRTKGRENFVLDYGQ